MPSLNQSIVINVGEEYIETYLKKKGYLQAEECKGQAVKYWVDALLTQKELDVAEFERFLFDELFWGKRKTIYVYKLDKVKGYKYPMDWETAIKEHYGYDTIEFCNVLGVFPTREEPRKIVAAQYEENYKGELTRVRLLFACYIQVSAENGYADSISYIPVEVDFVRKVMLIKAWTRNGIPNEDNKAEKLITHTKTLMAIQFKVYTKSYMAEHKKVLFSMSKSLIYKAYSMIPAYNEISKCTEVTQKYINEILKILPVSNVVEDGNGKLELVDGVVNLEAEIRNVLEGVAISDYFFQRDFAEIWEMGLEAVVARIKFNDAEKVLTSLSGENTTAPIFCTKTFMSLKNRMEETEKIESLWITKERKRGNLNLKFDASDDEHLEILIKYGIRFNEEDMNSALGIYDKYEAEINKKTTEQCDVAIGQ